MSKFSAKDYNFVAKRIREVYPTQEVVIPAGSNVSQIQRRVLERLAINFTKRFRDDNENFDAFMFLDACSPDIDRFPLSELWSEEWKKNKNSTTL